MVRAWLGWLLVFAAAAAGCQSSADLEADEAAVTEASGASLYRPGNRFAGWGGEGDPYLDEVQPLLGKRCVTCHGCSSSPCQLKLTSYEGVRRGANAHSFYAANPEGPTRLKDGSGDDDWRRKGFYSVVSGGESSIMSKMIAHGQQHNTPGFDLAPAYAIYKGRAERLEFACVDGQGELDERLARPGTGMPLGLPGLPSDEAAVLLQWIERGAPGPSADAQAKLEAPRDAAKVAAWEALFNRADPKSRLATRYIYEHTFFGKLHFDDSAEGRGDFFELVRSSTDTGPIRELVTEAPNEDPGAPFYYRLKKFTPLVTAKDHIVFHLDAKVMRRWTELLYESEWTTTASDDFAAHNPFRVFEAIPGTLRYQFMLENAHRLIDAMVKGDVCTGELATSAIRDRFATLFLKPSSDPTALDPKLGQASFDHLDPSAPSPMRDAALERLIEAKLKELRPTGLGEADVWDGDQKDRNAWVTVLRHDTSSSAHQGPLGQQPDSMWILDYANFERLYYALVALYKPWGSGKLKSDAWMTMAQVRSHSEDLFLLLAPEDQRDDLRKKITPGFTELAATPMRGVGFASGLADVDRSRPVEHITSRLRARLGAAVAPADSLERDPMSAAAAMPSSIATQRDVDRALAVLAADSQKLAASLPEVTWLTVEDGAESYAYSLIANRIFGGSRRSVDAPQSRHPELESVAIARGRVGGFPQLFLRVPIGRVAEFVRAGTGSAEARAGLRTSYEIRRNTPDFWAALEAEHVRALREQPLEAGIIDTSAYLWPADVESQR